jgi:hypothetical protein
LIPDPLRPPEGAEPFDNSDLKLNISEDRILENVERNIRRGLPQLNVYPTRPEHVCLVAGGWSLDDTFDELRDLYWAGSPLIALNGAGNWLVERNLRPGALVVLDARPMNVSFVEREIPKCKYFLASQCDPGLFDACEGREVYVFHALTVEREKDLLEEYYRGRYHHVVGGSTVGLRAITLARFLGFEFMHLFGFDSCYTPEGKHHAYAQPWNENEGSTRMWCAGKEFRCSAWQASQAEQFVSFVKVNGEHFHLSVHGDGLLAHIVQTGAELSREKED